MTTLDNNQPELDRLRQSLRQRLEHFGRLVQQRLVLEGAARWLILIVAMALAAYLLDRVLRLSAHVEGTRGELLHQAGRGRHIDDVEIYSGVGEEAFRNADIPRPADRIGGADHSGGDGLGGLDRRRRKEGQHTT